jgi:hypothetical protein
MDEYFVEEKTAYDKLLDFLVFIAVFVVTIFLIAELFGVAGKGGIDVTSVNNIYFWINFVVFGIFVLDLIRLWKKSSDFKDFMANNWLDVLATIPFELLAYALGNVPVEATSKFGILKMIRLTKLTGASRITKISRISKISKEFKAAAHLKKEGEEYKRKHRL